MTAVILDFCAHQKKRVLENIQVHFDTWFSERVRANQEYWNAEIHRLLSEADKPDGAA